MEDKLTIDQFAEKIKTKYPAYKDMDNGELTQKIIDKYPVYKDQVDFEKKNQNETLDSSLEETSMDVTKESGDGIQESSSKDEPIAQDVAQDEGVLDRVKNYFLNSVNEYEAGVKERSSDRSNYKSSFSNMTDDERGKASLSTLMTDALYNTVTNVLPSEIQTTVEFSPLSDELDRINEGIAKAKKNNEDSVTIESAPPVIGLTGPNTNLKNEPSKKYSLEDAYKKRTEIQKKANESYVSIKKKLNDSEEMSLASDGSYSEMFTAQGLINLVATQAPRLGVSVVAPVIGSYAQIYGNTYIDNLTAIAAKENGVDERNVTPKMIVDQIDTGNDGKEVSMIASGIGASLDMIGLGAMTNRIKAPLVGFIRQHVKKGLQKGGKAGAKKAISVASDLLTGANVLKGSAIEGGTETAQSVVQQVSKGIALDKTLKESFNSVDWHSSFKEGIAGAIMGGPVSGVTGRLKLTSQDVEAMIANYDVGGLTQFTEDGFIDWNTIPQRTKDKVKFLEKVKGEKIPYDLNEEELTKSKNEKYVEEKLGIKPKVEVDVKKDVDVEEQSKQQSNENDPTTVPSMDEGAKSNVNQVDAEARPRAEESTDQQGEVGIELAEGESVIDSKKDEKGRTYTYTSKKSEKDGVKTTKFSFNRDDKASDSRSVSGVSPELAFNNEFEVREEDQLDGMSVSQVFEIREGESSIGATVRFTDDVGNSIDGEVVLDRKESTEEQGKGVDQEVSSKPILNKKGAFRDSRKRKGLVPIEQAEEFIGEDRLGDAAMPQSRKTIDALKEDISKNGFKEPIIIIYDKEKESASIVEGNHRMAAAKELGLTEVPVTFEKGTLRSDSDSKRKKMFPLKRVKVGKIDDTRGVPGNLIGFDVRQPSDNDYVGNSIDAEVVLEKTEGQGSVEIESNETPVTIDNKKETATAQKKESKSVTNRIARARETTKKLRQKYKDIKDYKKNLIDSVYGRLKDKELNNLSNFFHSSVMKRLTNASTFESVDRILNKAFHDIATNEIKRADAVISDIVKKSKKNIKTENSRRKGNRVDNLTRKIFDGLRGLIDSKSSLSDLEEETKNIQANLQGMSELQMEDKIAELVSREILMKLAKADKAIKTAKDQTSELKNRTEYSEAQRADYSNRTLSLEEALRLKESAIDDMMKLIDGGKSNLKEEVAREAYRLKDIVENAIADTNREDIDSDEGNRDRIKKRRNIFQKAYYSALKAFNVFKMPSLSTFEFMSKMISNNSEIDNGYLRQKFYIGEEGYAKSLQRKRKDTELNFNKFKEKVSEIFKIKNTDWSLSSWTNKANEADENSRIFVLKYERDPTSGAIIKGGKVQLEKKPLSKMEALTVYLYSKMDGIKGNLEASGYTPESLIQVEEFLGKDFIALGDYMTATLEEKYEGYNKVYREIYRTEMEKVENYFPVEHISIDKKIKKDVSEDNVSNQITASAPSSSISRVANNNRINDSNGAAQLFLQQLEDVNHFIHTARVNKDMSAIIRNPIFRDNVIKLTDNGEMMPSLEGAIQSVSLSNTTPKEKTEATGRFAYGIQKGVQVSYIALRLWTAIKQTASAPAVLAEADNFRFGLGAEKRYIPYLSNAFGMGKFTGRMALSIPKLSVSHNFMYKNSQGYKDRIDSRDAGNEYIKRVFEDSRNDGSGGSKIDLARAKVAKVTLMPNTFVDAMTIAWSGKALYDQNLAKYKKEGRKDAHEQAIRDFEVYFQLSQQDSNAEHLSTIQRDKGWAGSFAAFQNSRFAYFRKVAGSVYSLSNSYRNEKARLKKLGDKNAGKNALKKVLKSEEDIKNMQQFFVFGYVLPFTWQYLLSGLPGFATEYEDEEDDYDLITSTALGPVDGLFIAKDVVKFGLDKTVGGKPFDYQPSILFQEVNEMAKDFSKAFASDELYDVPILAMKYTLKFKGGIDYDSSAKMYEAITEILNKGGVPSYENVLKLMNAPKSLVGEEEEESSLEFMDDNRDFSEGEFMDDNREFSDN